MNYTYKIVFFVLLVFYISIGFGQEKIVELPPKLKESSALIKLDSKFLTVNDSGNQPIVYVFDDNGKILNECEITNAKNKDWEALTIDNKGFLYIGDIGNNQNKRKDLVVYKVPLADVLTRSTTTAESIYFSYPDQVDFPPSKDKFHYDAEALFFWNEKLVVVTKNWTQPYDGLVKFYSFPSNPGTYSAHLEWKLQLEPTFWMENSITDAFYFENEFLYILTYAKIYKIRWIKDEFKLVDEKTLSDFSQKEGISGDKKHLYLTDENDKKLFKSNYLYRLDRF